MECFGVQTSSSHIYNSSNFKLTTFLAKSSSIYSLFFEAYQGSSSFQYIFASFTVLFFVSFSQICSSFGCFQFKLLTATFLLIDRLINLSIHFLFRDALFSQLLAVIRLLVLQHLQPRIFHGFTKLALELAVNSLYSDAAIDTIIRLVLQETLSQEKTATMWTFFLLYRVSPFSP